MTKYEDVIKQISEDVESAITHDGSLKVTGTGGSVDIQTNGDIIGVWITPNSASNGVPCISLYHENRQGTVIGIYGPDKRNKGLTVALSVDKDGNANLQVCRGRSEERSCRERV